MSAILISSCISSFLSSFMGSSINIAIPFISSEYGVAPESITWVFNAFMITSAAILLPATAMANRLGYAKTYCIGTLAAAITTFLVPLAPTFSLLVLARAIQGIAYAIFFCSGMAVLVDRTPKEQRASALAFCVSSVYAGLSFSPIVAGVLADYLGWQSIFYAAALGQAISFLFALKVPFDKGQSNYYPFLKMLLCFIAGSLFLLSISILDLSSYGLYLLGVALILLLGYLIIESTSNHPVLPVFVVIKNLSLSLSLLVAMLNFIATFAMGMLLSMHLQIILGHTAVFTGIVLMVLPVVMLGASSLTSKLTAKFGAHLLTTSGMIIMCVGLAGYIFLEPNTSLTFILICQALIGFGNGLFSAPNANIIMSSVKREQYALASSLQSIVRTSGMAISMAIVTLLLNAYISAAPHTTLYVRELSGAIGFIFIISTAVCLAGAVIDLISSFIAKAQNKATAHA